MKSLFTLALFLLPFLSFGQNYVVDLQNHDLNIRNRRFYISRVIDARLETSNIGSVQTGAFSAMKTAAFSEEFSPALLHFFERTIPLAQGMQPVIMKVTQLRLKQKAEGMAQYAIAEVEVEFLYESKPNVYLKLYDAGSVMQKKANEVKDRHDKNLVAALEHCLSQLADQDFNQLVSQAEIVPSSQLEARLPVLADSFQFPILRDTVYRVGVYQNFREFRNNVPGLNQPIVVDARPRIAKVWQGTYDVQPYLVTAAGSRVKPKDAWGFSDGKKVYVQFNNTYYPLERSQQVFTFFGHVIESPTPQTSVVVGGAVSGLVVGAVVSRSSGNTTGKAEYVVDMVTGRISEISTYAYQPTQTAKVIIYNWVGKSDEALPVNIVLKNTAGADSLVNALKPNGYLALEWNDLRSDLSICVQNQPEACLTFIPKVDQTTYLEYIPAGKKSGTAIIKPAIVKEAQFYIKKMEATEKRGSSK